MALIEDKIYDTVFDSLPDLFGKCYAITGTTSGTGFVAATSAIRKGASCVFLLNRASSRATEVEHKLKLKNERTKVVAVDCDLQSFTSVRKAARQVRDLAVEFGGLDGLLNNAGVMALPDQRTADGHDVQMQTNHLSHFLLTKLLLPSLESAASTRGEARIVQHSSSARAMGGNLKASFFTASEPGSLGGDAMHACFSRYQQSKLASPVFAMALHNKLVTTGSHVKSLCAEPGVSATNLQTNMDAGHAVAKAGKSQAKQGKSQSESSPMPGVELKPQSASDGACPLIMAAFAGTANSGDFYMPGDVAGDGWAGMPVKCISAGKPTPTNDRMKMMFRKETLTMNEANHRMLWVESEKVTDEFKVGVLSKL